MSTEAVVELLKLAAHFDGVWAFLIIVTTVLICRMHLIVASVMNGLRLLAPAPAKRRRSKK
jgi:hypothetical protein